MKKPSKHLVAILTLSITLLLSACDGDDYELTRYISKIKQKPPIPIKSLPEFQPLPKYDYPENAKRRSPFRAVQVRKQATGAKGPDLSRPRQELEKFPLDALKYVGLLKNRGHKWALIKRPDGKIDKVHVGQYMGKNHGKITKVNIQGITLEETVRNESNWEKRTTTLRLNAGN